MAAVTSAQGARILDRYALFDQIASGGMATVHVGRLLGPVGFSRTVAIKRLHPQYAKEPDFVSMFLDEARLAARVRHPNVVGTLDVVALDGELFLVMEYVEGESLARVMRSVRDSGGPVPVPIAASILVDVLEGLHAAHEATSDHGEPLGIVHRDVSPQNILIGTDGIARVLDFGVAKAAGRAQNTRDGQLKGKLGYMAPEQIAGLTTRVTDVHAASVVLWEMLTGRRLYHAENELQTYANILAGNAAPPSTHNPQVEPELDELVLRGLSSNPLARFASARDMARALQKTTRLASALDVGDWLDEIAGPDIRARAQKVAAIESTGSFAAVSLQAPRDSVSPSSPPVTVGQRTSRGRLVLIPVLVAVALAAWVALHIGTRGQSSGYGVNSVAQPVPPPTPSRDPSAASAFVNAPAESPSIPSSAPVPTEMAWSKPASQRSVRKSSAANPPAASGTHPSRETAALPDQDFSHVLDSRK